MNAQQKFILASARLARSSPEGWQQFLGAFREFSDTYRDNCIQAPLDVLPVAQGRAQSLAHTHGLMADCQSAAEKIEGKRK